MFKNLTQLIIFLFVILSGCEEASNNSVSESEPIITFEKYVDNIKSAVRQTNGGGYIVAGGLGGQAWLLKLDRYG